MRKHKCFLFCIVFSFISSAHAGNFHLLNGIGFTAPNVDGTSNVGSPQTGDIVFDTSNNSFVGYGGSTPGWIVLGTASYYAPTVQKFTSSSGTYTPPSNPSPLYIKVVMVGGGGGGGGSGTSGLGSGGNGTSSTFGPSGSPYLTAGGGYGGSGQSIPSGGSPTVTGANVTQLVALQGAPGGSQGIEQVITSIGAAAGGSGGASPFGGAGSSSITSGNAAITNSGSGGGGAGGSASGLYTATGGAAGAYIEAIITSPVAYSYAVGSGGSYGGMGTSGNNGGAGGSGYIVVTEYYQ